MYQIKIDNDGDAQEDITFQFYTGNQLGGQASTKPFNIDDELCAKPGPTPFPATEPIHLGTTVNILNANGSVNRTQFIPLKFSGPVDSINDENLNWFETYQLNMIVDGARTAVTKSGTNNAVFEKPFDYAGEKTFPNYDSYANLFKHEIDIPGCTDAKGRVFVGQRAEPFHVNLGAIFDLVNFVPIPGFPGAINERDCHNDLRYINVDSFVLEVPTRCIVGEQSDVIGAWTTVNELCHVGSDHQAGDQVSRLGMPLVNEVVIGIADKGTFNKDVPANDGANFLSYVQYPSFPAIIDALFRTTVNNVLNVDLKNIAPGNLPRDDLVTVFLTGIPGINQPPFVTASEMLRLNTSIPARSRNDQNRFGVIEGDAAGFPNGRRPGDDVIDIVMRVAMGKVCYLDLGVCSPSDAPVGDVDFTDGAPLNAEYFDNTFPYLRTPIPGSPFPGQHCSGSSLVASLSVALIAFAAYLF
tara:strand:- start:233 stop:1639 length:1407 start_codon:yes stop_codon:yes gene_type:complete